MVKGAKKQRSVAFPTSQQSTKKSGLGLGRQLGQQSVKTGAQMPITHLSDSGETADCNLRTRESREDSLSEVATPDPVRDTASRNKEKSKEGRHSINSGISTCIFTQVHVHLYVHKWHIHIWTHITFIKAIIIKVIFKRSKKAEMSVLNSRSIIQRIIKTFFTFSYRLIYCLLFNPQEYIYFLILQMMKQKSGKDKKPAQIVQLERDDVRVWSMYIIYCGLGNVSIRHSAHLPYSTWSTKGNLLRWMRWKSLLPERHSRSSPGGIDL